MEYALQAGPALEGGAAQDGHPASIICTGFCMNKKQTYDHDFHSFFPMLPEMRHGKGELWGRTPCSNKQLLPPLDSS